MAPGSITLPGSDKLTPEKCKQLLQHYRTALACNMGPRSTLFYLFQERVFSKETIDDIRKKGKGDQYETNVEIIEQLMQKGVREFEVLIKILRKLQLNLLADILEEQRTSDILHLTEPTSRKLGFHWKRIADELGMKSMIPIIQDRYPDKLREQALYMLLMWEERDGIGANGRRLTQLLEMCNMRAAAENVEVIMNGGKKKKKKKKGKKGKKSGKKKSKSAKL
ncbi:uncharacterized protein [Ptychodera flava]|uniref:uncharacterized protein n=1 Tax=Ptychodera flava TaxID=63121 RepID=UPI003969D532